MRTAILALLLLLPAAASAEDLDPALSALVRISGTRDGTPVRGSGFVVGLDRDEAMIVTVSHVIAGVEKIEVTFAADLTRSFPAAGFMRMDAGNPRGPAVLQVRGSLPAEVTTLSFEVENRPRVGTALFLLGFPEMATSPRTSQRVLSARDGTALLVDQGSGEGFSGGPVLQAGKVVGVITDTDEQTTYAVNAVVVHEALEGWRVKLGNLVATCVPGQEAPENGIGIVFVRLCPGTFIMGSAENDPQAEADEKPAHQVRLSEFWIGRTEITNAQYRNFQPHHQGEDRLPAVHVSWTEAKAACESFGGRLPTEAEWEYAARAGRQTAWSFGHGETLLADYAWYDKNSDSGTKPHPVATRTPNTWGLYDMHGNVWEWVGDWYAPYEKGPQTDPAGPKTGQHLVLRGGSFIDPAKALRSADRYKYKLEPESRNKGIGFRCVRGLRRQP
jgi:formylglycine-generating enzyme required for sulfatase activity